MVVAASSTLLTDWQFSSPQGAIYIRPQPRLIVTANQPSINAACLGWGLTRVLSYQVASQVAAGELEIVLQAFEQPALPIHVVHQSGRKVPAKVRTFVDFCVAQLSQASALNPSGRN
ncbi:MAG: hypothetical protein K2X80_11635 [Pseudomonadaceae bacterium]|nr:hypothetical protein [Pseudomonadaceae bacterium]